MARPLKYYVVFEERRAIDIAHGIDAARKRHAGFNGFKTLVAAEEFAAWWNHDRDTREAANSRTLSLSTEQKPYHRSRRLWAYPSGGYQWVETYTHFVAHQELMT